MDKTKPHETRRHERKPSSQEDSLDHIKDTFLPPGIDVEDVKDPGRNSPKGPVDNRS